jgi:hypothetical protein
LRLVARKSNSIAFFSASARAGRFRLIDPNKCRVQTAGLVLFFEPERVEFERAAVLRHRAHSVLGDAVRHLCFNLKYRGRPMDAVILTE